ncbi:MAG: OB-fold nucleic acid binding domain-containing protein [Candidatus Pacearchaeota archaeon]|nr:OB-fold nucleic acid binding domain-containing protein [Candidatus Pacearchaeota archaeon]
MQEEIKKRFVAHKLSLGQLANGKPEFEQERFSRLVIDGKDIVRVNVIATIVDKFINEQGSYASLILDDGTGTIRAKAFSENVALFKDFQLGDTVKVIGLLRFFNDELYILPEIIKEIDPRWLLVRKLELAQEYGNVYNKQEQKPTSSLLSQSQASSFASIEETKNEEIEQEKIEDIKEDENNKEKSLRDQILDIIRAAELEEGIDVDKLIMSLTAPVDIINNTIIELLEEGSIFEPRPGRLRVL